MKFSIIIPVYNYPAVVSTMRGIRAQIENDNHFEVILVDDASTDGTYQEILAELAGTGGGYSQLVDDEGNASWRCIRHSENRRQGGARNTAVKEAKGDYIFYLDADDYFVPGALKKVADYLTSHSSLDVLMCDSALDAGKGQYNAFHYRERNSSEILSGREFMCKQEIPWVPWLYVYRRKFLEENQLEFVEHVRNEDMDYVMKVTVFASQIQYQPILLVVHTVYDGQTSFVGNNVSKINDMFASSYRVRLFAEDIQSRYPEASKAVLGHHLFAHKANLSRFFWRLPFAEMREILRKYPVYTPSGSPFLEASSKHPLMFCIGSWGLKPFLYCVWHIKRMFRK